jgi:hypothetical protein
MCVISEVRGCNAGVFSETKWVADWLTLSDRWVDAGYVPAYHHRGYRPAFIHVTNNCIEKMQCIRIHQWLATQIDRPLEPWGKH